MDLRSLEVHHRESQACRAISVANPLATTSGKIVRGERLGSLGGGLDLVVPLRGAERAPDDARDVNR